MNKILEQIRRDQAMAEQRRKLSLRNRQASVRREQVGKGDMHAAPTKEKS